MINSRELELKILAKDIPALARAITLNESTRIEDNIVVDEIISRNASKLNNSLVISISGIPGVGKSTFIEVLGVYLHSLGKSIAVFSIDPSSELSHGSILGDKTRMNDLSRLENVFIRPSPSSNRLGGLGMNTHKNIELAKIAGYDVILVETVGVGQSETIVKNLCDLFLLLLMPASGDELQGIKKGIMEVADFYVIHKADGELMQIAEKSKKEIETALHLTKSEIDAASRIFTFSSVSKAGLERIWNAMRQFVELKRENHSFENNRVQQRFYWLKESFNQLLFSHLKNRFSSTMEDFETKISNGEYIGTSELLGIIKEKLPVDKK